jgi:hypothetical protein
MMKKNAGSTISAVGRKKTSSCKERTASDDSRVQDFTHSDDGRVPTLKAI